MSSLFSWLTRFIICAFVGGPYLIENVICHITQIGAFRKELWVFNLCWEWNLFSIKSVSSIILTLSHPLLSPGISLRSIKEKTDASRCRQDTALFDEKPKLCYALQTYTVHKMVFD